ncbi:MAG TPA: excinuclease ABC subunit UvrA [Candidatus Binatia bacterium]|nr:excinuclease ABC subunit UvrA [Candidatus Binatia bacterium]
MADRIVVRGAREHNLKNVDVTIPRDRLVVVTGLSGSGKSSLAFDTIYAEGQRRYVESLSAYARQFLEQMQKPDVDSIDGLSPAISIEQKTTSRNPRSTVGTVTEIYDYLRLLFARVGIPHCHRCGKPITSQTVQQIVDHVMRLGDGTRIHVLAPIARDRKGEYKKELLDLRKAGFARVRVDGALRDLGEDIVLKKTLKHTIDVVVDRLVVKAGIEKRLADSLETAFRYGDDLVKVEVVPDRGASEASPRAVGPRRALPDGARGAIPSFDGQEHLFSQRLACPDCGVSYPELAPRMFSFNSPHGACPACSGLGVQRVFDPMRIVADEGLSLAGGAIAPWGKKPEAYRALLDGLARHLKISVDTAWSKLPQRARDAVLHGTGDDPVDVELTRGRRFSRPFEGVVKMLERRYRETDSPLRREELEAYQSERPCSVCGGTRLKPEAEYVKLGGRSISEVTALSIAAARDFVAGLELTPQQMEIARLVIKEITERLGFLSAVGLTYLTLDRSAGSLSGGEGQRIRLATQIGSSLVGVLYILDEPSIGLHQRDNERLLETLKRLRDLGNSVIVVEHDRETMVAADHLLDIGPGAGRLGGEIVAQGTPAEVARDPASLTGQYLSGRREIAIPRLRRRGTGWTITVKGARQHNLKNVTASIPLGTLTCVTGVSGSGKSSLVIDTLFAALAQKLYRSREPIGDHDAIEGWQLLDKVVDIDQAPIGRTPRSNPATYTGLFAPIRDLFAQLPESRVRGYEPGRFSFNVKGGRCESCAGDGLIKIEMHFLPDVYVTCEVCGGRRYNRETLEVLYKGKSIADVLDMSVVEALDFLSAVPACRQKLETLRDVGLEYVHLGQSATTLSGGEAQRIKLAKELSRRATGRTLYILDEPTTGMHFEDIRRLLEVLGRLVDGGNTVVVIEHNLDVIKTADQVIDLGPEGGDAGGEIVVAGTPEEVARHPRSHTGRFLRAALGGTSRTAARAAAGRSAVLAGESLIDGRS